MGPILVVNKIIQKFENEVISRIGDREVFCENPVKTFVFPVFGIGFQLEKVSE